jgi:hypothetical protein
MGASGSKAHETFTVNPTDATASSAADFGHSGVDAWTNGGASSFSDALIAVTNATNYNDLVNDTKSAAELLDELGAAGVPVQVVADAAGDLKGVTKQWFAGLEVTELQKLAGANGFEHPTLVGLNPTGAHPLVHWLDPAYPPDTDSKLKIAAKAQERFGMLAAGETIAGMTFDDVVAAEQNLGLLPASGQEGFDQGAVDYGNTIAGSDTSNAWVATPQQVAEAQAEHADAIAAMSKFHTTDEVYAVLKTENRIATAVCPSLPMDKIRAAGANLTDSALPPLYHGNVGTLIKEFSPGGISPGQTRVATKSEAWAMLRASTSDSVREALAAKFLERNKAVDYVVTHHDAFVAMAGTDTLQLQHGEPGEILGFAVAASKYMPAAQLVRNGTQYGSWIGDDTVPKPGWHETDTSGLTQKFRAWAKTETMQTLRFAGNKLGLESWTTATRAQLQNYVASHWDQTIDQADIVAKAAATKTPKPKPPAPPTPTPSPAVSSSPTPAQPVTVTPAVAGTKPGDHWASKHVATINALKHHLASTQSLPPRTPEATVSAWTFGPPKGAALGGGHSKSLHDAPDGSLWLYKPDKSAGGARAHAEAAASRVFERAGIASVPVYAKTIGNQTGSIQPLIAGVSNLGNTTSSWSQQDVDSIVRVHVASWAISDHDGHGANMLRTSQGGLMPCDQGQAFKFFGRDTLSSSYHPNASWGTQQPVYMQAYAAAKTGQLAPGVKVRPEAALPVIKAFESIPDNEYRSMLSTVADEGTKTGKGVDWYEPMRQRAALTHGTKTPSRAQIGDAFLTYAVERKNNLRAEFQAFFDSEGITHKLDLVK